MLLLTTYILSFYIIKSINKNNILTHYLRQYYLEQEILAFDYNCDYYHK